MVDAVSIIKHNNAVFGGVTHAMALHCVRDLADVIFLTKERKKDYGKAGFYYPIKITLAVYEKIIDTGLEWFFHELTLKN